MSRCCGSLSAGQVHVSQVQREDYCSTRTERKREHHSGEACTHNMHTQTHKEPQGYVAEGRNSRVGEVTDRMSALLTEVRRLDLKDGSVLEQ